MSSFHCGTIRRELFFTVSHCGPSLASLEHEILHFLSRRETCG